MKPGDWVNTPNGTGQILHIRMNRGWHYDRYRNEPLLIIRYPGGHRHAWVPSKVQPITREAK